MEWDWKKIAAIAAVGGGIVTLHGITNKRWEWWHTAFAVLALIAYFGPQLGEA